MDQTGNPFHIINPEERSTTNISLKHTGNHQIVQKPMIPSHFSKINLPFGFGLKS